MLTRAGYFTPVLLRLFGKLSESKEEIKEERGKVLHCEPQRR